MFGQEAAPPQVFHDVPELGHFVCIPTFELRDEDIEDFRSQGCELLGNVCPSCEVMFPDLSQDEDGNMVCSNGYELLEAEDAANVDVSALSKHSKRLARERHVFRALTEISNPDECQPYYIPTGNLVVEDYTRPIVFVKVHPMYIRDEGQSAAEAKFTLLAYAVRRKNMFCIPMPRKD